MNRRIAVHKIACGELAAQYLFGTTKEVMILPNAVDIDAMIDIASNSIDYIEKNFENKGLKIVQVGRLNEVKNHQFSLRVAEELKKHNIDFTIYFIGQGPLENQLKQQVRNKSLQSEIKFSGVRSDVTELMASADYMIMPSLHEGFPVVLVESQVIGLRAIVSDQISDEVDLNLGLVEFLSLNSVKDWVSHLSISKKLDRNDNFMIDSLKLQGFDAITNAKKISEFYKSL